MSPERQESFDWIEDLESVERELKRPSPRKERLGRTFDLPTRAWMNSAIENVLRQRNFSLEDIFPEDGLEKPWHERDEVDIYLPAIRLYLYPQKDEEDPLKEEFWLNQEEVALQLGWDEKAGGRIRPVLLRAVGRIRERAVYGVGAIEELMPTKYLYNNLKEAGINRVDDIFELEDERVAEITTSRAVLNELKRKIEEKWGIKWEPQVSFRLELSQE